jgi:hypothetical protein
VPVRSRGLHDGVLYFVVDEPGGEQNGLYQLDVCGGSPRPIYTANRVAGIPGFTKEWIYVPVLAPGSLVRVRYDGSSEEVLRTYDEVDPERPRAVTSVPEDEQKDWSILVSTYNYDGGLFLYGMGPTATRLDLLAGGLTDPSWVTEADPPPYPDAPLPLPNTPLDVGFLADPEAGATLFLAHGSGIEELRSNRDFQRTYSYGVAITPLVHHDGFVYYMDWNDAYRAPVITGLYDLVPPELLFEVSQPGGIAIDDEGWLYFTESYQVSRYQVATGAVEGVFSSNDYARDIVLSPKSLYVRTDTRITRAYRECPLPGDQACNRL